MPAEYPAADSAAGRDAILGRVLELAGDLPRHIEMRASGPRKYVERPNALHPGPAPVTGELLRRHLGGEITVGAYLRRSDGLSFAVCWDADDPGGWRRLQGTGLALLRAGALPIAERSPAAGEHAGGGHLWLVFSAPVDPGAALATAARHAPELAGYESWPGGGAVRLLGGTTAGGTPPGARPRRCAGRARGRPAGRPRRSRSPRPPPPPGCRSPRHRKSMGRRGGQLWSR